MQLDQLLTQLATPDQARLPGDASHGVPGDQPDFLQLLTMTPPVTASQDAQRLPADGIELPEEGTVLPPAHIVVPSADQDTSPRLPEPSLAALTRAIRDEMPRGPGLTPAIAHGANMSVPEERRLPISGDSPVRAEHTGHRGRAVTPMTQDLQGATGRQVPPFAELAERFVRDGLSDKQFSGVQPVADERNPGSGVERGQTRVPGERADGTPVGLQRADLAARPDVANQRRTDAAAFNSVRGSEIAAAPSTADSKPRADAAIDKPLPPPPVMPTTAAIEKWFRPGAELNKPLPPPVVTPTPIADERPPRPGGDLYKPPPPPLVVPNTAVNAGPPLPGAELDKPLPPPAVTPLPADTESRPGTDVAIEKPLPSPQITPPATTVAGTVDASTNRLPPGMPSLNIPNAVTDPEWREAVGSRIAMLAGRNISSAELRLSPAELGPVQVQIAVDDNVARITFSATHSLTREQLELALPRLREMLAEQGVTLGDANVTDRHAGGQTDGQDRSANNDVEPLRADAPGDSIESAAAPMRQVIGSGRVDTYA